MFYSNLQQIIYLYTVPVYLPVFYDSVTQKCVFMYLFFFLFISHRRKTAIVRGKNESAKLVSEDLKKTVEMLF